MSPEQQRWLGDIISVHPDLAALGDANIEWLLDRHYRRRLPDRHGRAYNTVLTVASKASDLWNVKITTVPGVSTTLELSDESPAQARDRHGA